MERPGHTYRHDNFGRAEEVILFFMLPMTFVNRIEDKEFANHVKSCSLGLIGLSAPEFISGRIPLPRYASFFWPKASIILKAQA